jgi:hypothetical protein
MALNRRGKQVIGGAALLTAIGVVAALAFSGNAPAPIQRALDSIPGVEPPPPVCPLTGRETPKGDEVTRPLLAIKVENTDASYPQVGIDRADMVYEEVVEGGITRFVALYHCRDAQRVGPVRSARTTDPKILVPFQQEPLMGYSGGAPKVVKGLTQAGVVQLTEANHPEAFTRDPARIAPHNLFTATNALWKAGIAELDNPATPRGVFSFDEDPPEVGSRARAVSVVFSTLSSTGWDWSGGRWVRRHGEEPWTLEDGTQVSADNLVIQFVKVGQDTIRDASGAYSPLVAMTGKGKAWVLRNGTAIRGTWERATEHDLTVFRTRDGDEIALAPGVTWVELVPVDGEVTISKSPA